MVYICLLEIDDVVDIDKAQDIKAMSSLFNITAEILDSDNERGDLDGAKMDFLEHVEANLIIDIEDEIHLPDLVFIHQSNNGGTYYFSYYAING